MGLDLYYIQGSAPSRAVRLCAETLGLKLNLIVVDLFNGEQMKPEFLKLNPAHAVPVLNDNGFILTECRAILGYLVNKYGKDDSLYPKEPEKRARVDEILYFDISNLYQKLIDYYIPVFFGTKLNPENLKKLEEAFGIFDKFLEGRDFAAGNHLTIADFSVVAGVSTADILLDFDVSKYPNVFRWYNKCKTTMKGYDESNVLGLRNTKVVYDQLLKKCT